MAKVAIVYASSMGRTQKMAEAIADGVKTIDGVDLVLKDVKDFSADDAKDAGAIAVGGGTYNYALTKAILPALDTMKDVGVSGKVGAAFGSYGWSGESVPTIIERLKELNMNVIEPGIKAKQNPDEEAIKACFMLGRSLAQGVKG